MREGVRDAYLARGEPIPEEIAAAAALQALSAEALLVPLALARAGGVSELELFLDHFRSALADGHRHALDKIVLSTEPERIGYVARDAHDVAPLDDRVEWSVWGVLASARDVDARSLLRRTYALFRGVETPDRELIERCLASYAAQSDEGRWRLADADGLVARQASQAQVVADLVDAGHRLGFRVHVGRELQRRAVPVTHAERGRTLVELMTDSERLAGPARSVRGPAEALEIVDELELDDYHVFHAVRADLLRRLGRDAEAAAAYEAAIARSENEVEREFLRRRLGTRGRNYGA
jgi:hypothetical protein